MSYLIQERGQYEPPACPGCGRRVQVDWLDCTTMLQFARGERHVIPGRHVCETLGCRYSPAEKS